ncbi:hypothetical protein CHARACLAT_022167 [Characodon lateralis]|uniref:Uncharacterized protein n=1 Tax=Characodon lateralis TaxID=208331 RepID=A0ABU7DKM3_9TELE|nr:hypothetical protein [Characodon lateralis]
MFKHGPLRRDVVKRGEEGLCFNCAMQSTIMPKDQLLAAQQKPVWCQMADFYVIFYLSCNCIARVCKGNEIESFSYQLNSHTQQSDSFFVLLQELYVGFNSKIYEAIYNRVQFI